MAENLEENIRQNAQGPAEASGDAGSVKQHSLSEQIAADRYLEGKRAMRKRGLKWLLKKFVPGGTE